MFEENKIQPEEKLKIPVTYYIARNNRDEALKLLASYGITVPEPKSPMQIARGLSYIIQKGNAKDAEKIRNIHPDADVLLHEATPVEFNTAGNEVVEEIIQTKPENKTEIIVKNAEPIIGVKVAYTLLGSAITLTVMGIASWAVKNIKQN